MVWLIDVLPTVNCTLLTEGPLIQLSDYIRHNKVIEHGAGALKVLRVSLSDFELYFCGRATTCRVRVRPELHQIGEQYA